MILHRISTTGTRTSGRNILIAAGAFNSGYNRQLTLTASCTALFITAKRVFLRRDTVQSCEDKLDVGLHSSVFNLVPRPCVRNAALRCISCAKLNKSCTHANHCSIFSTYLE